MIEKIVKKVYKIMLIVLGILVAYATMCSIFNIHGLTQTMKPTIITIGIIVCIFLFLSIYRLFKKVPEKNSNIIAVIICVLFFILLILFGITITSIPIYDLSDVIKEANLMLQNNGKFVTDNYFSIYPNQIPFGVAIYYIYKLGSILRFSNLKYFAVIINSLFIAVTAFFTYLSTKKIKDYKAGMISLLFFVFNPIFYMYSSYFYTDTICMPFAAISIYILLILKEEKSWKKKILLGLISGIALCIGYKIRVVVGIILIGYIIWRLLIKIKKIDIITEIISVIVGFIIAFSICHFVEVQANPISNENLKFPTTHWIMMGMNYDKLGKWNQNDYDYTYNKNDYNSKVKSNIKVIKKRIKSLGIGKQLELQKNKISVNWSNGTYGFIDKFANVENINVFYEYIAGNKNLFIIYYCQICKAAVLGVLLISIIKDIFDKNNMKNKRSFIYISIFGFFVFYMIWEVAPRYSLTALPWIIILFGIVISYLEKIVNIKKITIHIDELKKIEININKIIKIFSMIIFILSLFLLIINFKKYAVDKDKIKDTVVMQYRAEDSIKISDKTIRQSFRTDKKFNRVSIWLINKNIEDEDNEVTNYEFALKKADGTVISTQRFRSDKIKDEAYKTFKFDRVVPNDYENFIIEISSNDATDKNTVEIAVYNIDNYSVYPNGDLSINNEKNEWDMKFYVANAHRSSYVSKKVYIAISCTIVIIEIFAFYPIIRNKND